MLQKQYRLPSKTKLKNPRFIKTSEYSGKYAHNGMDTTRFAFVVKKTLDKKAVTRNRVRRVFRSCIEELTPVITPGYDMLFFLEKGIIGKTRRELLTELQRVFEERGLFKNTKPKGE